MNPILSLCLLALALIQLSSAAQLEGCVMVTGASGYVAGHVVEYLLVKNYTVHGTVRDPESKNAKFLQRVSKPWPGRLKLFKADLNDDNPFEESLKGCVGMIHLASVVMANGVSHEDQVAVSVKGTISALEAAKKAGVKSVVVTSSTASIAPTKKKLGGSQPYTIEDVNDVATLHYGTYPYSKVKAEEATTEFMKKHNNPFKLATIHFPMAFGPQQNGRVTSSNMVIQHLMLGELPLFVLPLQFNVIDVRDVARAHVYALEGENAKGRYIIANDPKTASMSMMDVANVIRNRYRGFPISEYLLPLWAYRLFSFVDPRISEYDVDLAGRGSHPGYDGTKLTKDTRFKYMFEDPEKSILDCAESMIRYNVVDGNAKPLPFVMYAGVGLAALFVLILAAMCGLFSKSPAPEKKKTKKE